MFDETQRTALDRFEATQRRKALERMSMPAPSGRRTLLVPSQPLPVPREPDTVRDLSGPPMED